MNIVTILSHATDWGETPWNMWILIKQHIGLQIIVGRKKTNDLQKRILRMFKQLQAYKWIVTMNMV